MISLLYEKDILDTGGAVKNAAKFFANSNILIVNSDIFWKSYNLNDVQKLINSYVNNNKAHLLLVPKNNAKGLNKISGDFVLNKNLISRYKKGDDIFFYSGLQIIPANILLNFEYKKFSLNEIWDYLIKNQNLFGTTMSSNWFHVGDIQGLEIARKLDS